MPTEPISIRAPVGVNVPGFTHGRFWVTTLGRIWVTTEDLQPRESEIVDAVFQLEKSIRGEPVESCKLRYFNSFEFFDHTGLYGAIYIALSTYFWILPLTY